jgi:hypothetical protein
VGKDKTTTEVLNQRSKEWFEMLSGNKPVAETFELGPETVLVLLRPFDVGNPKKLQGELVDFIGRIAKIHSSVTGLPFGDPIPIDPALSWMYRSFYGSAFLLRPGMPTPPVGIDDVGTPGSGLRELIHGK